MSSKDHHGIASVEDPLTLPAGFHGPWLTAGSPGYEEARTIYARQHTQRPAVIAQCTSSADVGLAVGHARAHDLEIAVRCGGHHAAGWSSVNGGLVIDLRLMNAVHVDARSSTAWIGGGTLAGQLVDAAAEHGLAGVTGISSSVGLGGLLLHLGEGHLAPLHGFGVDQILELEVVTADGRITHVSPEGHPDLFWAMRGAGPNFGVATAIRIQLHPLPQHTLGGFISFGGEDVPVAADHLWGVLREGPAEYHPTVIYARENGAPILHVFFAHLGSVEDAESAVTALRACGKPLRDTVHRMSYRDLMSHVDDAGSHFVALDTYRVPLDRDPDAIKDLLLQLQADLPWSSSANGAFHLWPTRLRAAPAHESAAPRYEGVTLHLFAVWQDPADEDAEMRWMWDAGSALVEAGAEEASNILNHYTSLPDERIRATYGTDKYARLVAIKSRYDPHNVFHRNTNIEPHAESDSG